MKTVAEIWCIVKINGVDFDFFPVSFEEFSRPSNVKFEKEGDRYSKFYQAGLIDSQIEITFIWNDVRKLSWYDRLFDKLFPPRNMDAWSKRRIKRGLT